MRRGWVNSIEKAPLSSKRDSGNGSKKSLAFFASLDYNLKMILGLFYAEKK